MLRQETFRSFFPTARTSSTVLEVGFHPDMSPRPGPLEQGALDSPKKLEELDKQEEVIPLPPSASLAADVNNMMQAKLSLCALKAYGDRPMQNRVAVCMVRFCEAIAHHSGLPLQIEIDV